MRFRVEVICLHEDGAQERCGVMDLERHELAIETMAITPCETGLLMVGLRSYYVKTQNRGSQKFAVCPICGGQDFPIKSYAPSAVSLPHVVWDWCGNVCRSVKCVCQWV